jgi:hypothetical protein
MTLSAMAHVSGGSWFDPQTGAVKQASLYFYRAGTLDPITVYVGSDLSTPHPVPVLTTGYGRVPAVWVGEIEPPGYRIRVFDQFSTLMEDIDNIPGPSGASAGGGGGGTVDPGDPHLLRTGELIFAFSNAQPRPGAVLCNGKTIGSASSSANNAHADYYALFIHLWGQDLYGLLPVLPTRGATAEGDWAANKALTLPDFQGRVAVGMDAMGALAQNRLTGVPMSVGTQEKVGATGGEALHKLLLAEGPNHNHNITVSETSHRHWITGVDHLHGASTTVVEVGNHQHGGTTGQDYPDHAHDYTRAISSGFSPYNAAGSAAVAQGATTNGANARHQHDFSTSWAGAHTHSASTAIGVADRSLAQWSEYQTAGVTASSVAQGGDVSHNTTPLFIAMCVYMVL